MPYTILKKDTVASYLIKQETTRILLQTDDEKEINVIEIGDGNLNLVFAVNAGTEKLIVKQSVPYLRCAGEDFPLNKERMHYEILALKKAGELAANHIPKIYLVDEDMCLVAMQYLDRHIIMRKGMIECTSYPQFADHISTYLAETLFNTSSLRLESKEKAKLITQFNSNELRQLTEEFVFTNAFMPHATNKVRPALQKEAEALWKDSFFKENVLTLKQKFMSATDALIHGDLHTGSIMVNQDETYVIDHEFAYVGPFGFDLGALLGNLIMSWVSHFERSKNTDYQEQVLTMIQQFLTQFERKFLSLWNQNLSNPLTAKNFLTHNEMIIYQKRFMTEILRDAVGFAGCKIARRQLGIAGVADIREIAEDKAAARAETMALAIAREFVVTHQTFNRIEDIISLLRGFSAQFYPTNNYNYQSILGALGVAGFATSLGHSSRNMISTTPTITSYSEQDATSQKSTLATVQVDSVAAKNDLNILDQGRLDIPNRPT